MDSDSARAIQCLRHRATPDAAKEGIKALIPALNKEQLEQLSKELDRWRKRYLPWRSDLQTTHIIDMTDDHLLNAIAIMQDRSSPPMELLNELDFRSHLSRPPRMDRFAVRIGPYTFAGRNPPLRPHGEIVDFSVQQSTSFQHWLRQAFTMKLPTNSVKIEDVT